MSVAQWDTTLRLGFADIDDQHHRLVDLINEFDESVHSGRTGDVLTCIIHDLLHYAIHHFAFEETLMDQHRLDCGQAHKAEHQQLLNQMRSIQADIATGSAQAGELLVPLWTWLTRHLHHADVTLVQELKAKAVKSLL
jgi:hemerythrin